MGTTLGIPPNGFAGSAQQTPAVRNLHQSHSSKTLGHTKSVRRTRKKAGGKAPARRASASRARKPKGAVILTAGSAAAKAWGAKMKRLRKAKAKPSG